jgi:5-methylcytosine-specific restriction endonuclease McrA
VSGAPDPKSHSLARGERRRFRHKASKAEWALIVKAKQGPCRVCVRPSSNGSYWGKIELHHIVSKAHGGDDVEANIAPLCNLCHARCHAYEPDALAALAASLSESERAYVIAKLGEGGPARLFGVAR